MALRLFDEVYYIAHQGNLGSILTLGILCHAEVARRGLRRADISDPAVQRWRARPEPVFGRSIHDYVPFYFNPRNPMLYRLQHDRKHAHELVVLVVSKQAVKRASHVFSDGNAASRGTRFSADARILCSAREVLQAPSWSGFADGGRRRCAEVLVHQRLDATAIVGVRCASAAAARQLQARHGVVAEFDESLFF